MNVVLLLETVSMKLLQYLVKSFLSSMKCHLKHLWSDYSTNFSDKIFLESYNIHCNRQYVSASVRKITSRVWTYKIIGLKVRLWKMFCRHLRILFIADMPSALSTGDFIASSTVISLSPMKSGTLRISSGSLFLKTIFKLKMLTIQKFHLKL